MTRCNGLTSSGKWCRRNCSTDYCYQHLNQSPSTNPSDEVQPDKKDLVSQSEHSAVQAQLDEYRRELCEIYPLILERDGQINSLKEKISTQRNELSRNSDIHRRKNEKLKAKNQRINEMVNEIANLKRIIANHEHKHSLLSDEVQDLQTRNTELEEIAKKYLVIEEFEKMKTEIKKVYNWEHHSFQIGKLKSETQHHYILEKTFGMSIDNIIDQYWKLRQERTKYAHPFG